MKKNKTLHLYLSTLFLSIKLSFKASPAIMFLRLITLIIGAFIPTINIMGMKNIIDAFAVYNSYRAIYWFVVIGISQLTSAIINKVTNHLAVVHSDKISLIISEEVINKVNALDISYYDNPKLYDELMNVTRDIKVIPTLVWKVLASIQIAIKLLTSVFILLEYIWWSPIVIILSCLPNFIIDKKTALDMYTWDRDSATEIRKMNYSYDTLTSKYFCKDVRINRLKEYLLDKYKHQWNNWYNQKHKLLTKQFVLSFITMFFPHIITLLVAAIILNGILNAEFTAGDFSYCIGIMSQITSSVFGIITVISEIVNQKTKLYYYNNFKSWKPLVDNNGNKPLNSIDILEFKNVCFKYPNTNKNVLENISFTIKKGEKIGIVGENGSGKTTIVKLLLRLYDPSSGRILINNQDIKEYNMDDYYKLISSFLQDYINYSFTLKENIQTADIKKSVNEKEIFDSCKKSNAFEFINEWENKLDEYLTKSFDISGKELSVGQWQKIALSRFFYKKAELYIMDEPSSSIDIESERIIFDNVFKSYCDNTVILISHSFSNLKRADKIIVIKKGKIIEMGTHLQLMQNKKLYYKLYNIQMERFI